MDEQNDKDSKEYDKGDDENIHEQRCLLGDKDCPKVQDVECDNAGIIEKDDSYGDVDYDVSSPITIDRGRAWFVMISCFLMHILVVGGGKSFGVFVQEFQDRFHVGAKELGTINGIALLLMFASSIFVNMLVLRFSARRVVIAGSILTSAGFIMTAFIPSFTWLYVTYGLVIGLGYGLSFSPTIVMVGQSFQKYRTVAYGFSLSGSGIGSFAIPNLVRALVNEYSLRGCLLILGAVMLNVCICGLLLPAHSQHRRTKKKTVCVVEKIGNEEKNTEDTVHDLKEEESKMLKCDNSESKTNDNINSASKNGTGTGCKIERDTILKTQLQDDALTANCVIEYDCTPKIEIKEADRELQVRDGIAIPEWNGKSTQSYNDPYQVTLRNAQNCVNNKYENATHLNPKKSYDLSISTKSLNENHLQRCHRTCDTLRIQQSKETVLSVSAMNLTNQSKTKDLLAVPNTLSKNRITSSLAYASSCDIAMMSQGNLDRLSIKFSRSQDLGPAQNGGKGFQEKAPLLEWSLLRNPPFIMHLVCTLLGFTCYMNILFMIADYASACGLSRDMAAMTLSVVGIVESVARLTFTPLSDFLCCGKRRSWAVALAVMGILNVCVPHIKVLSSLMAYAALFGYTCGCFTCLIPVLCAETNGPEKLGSSFGLTTFGMGLGLMAGPPICGAIKDQTGHWDTAFVTVGVMALVAAVVAFFEPTVQKRMNSSNES